MRKKHSLITFAVVLLLCAAVAATAGRGKRTELDGVAGITLNRAF